MATRTHSTWKLDNQNQFARKIGGHKFRLGSDLKAAQLRSLRIRELWRHIEGTLGTNLSPQQSWPLHALDMAKQIAKGETQVVLKRLNDRLSDESYARWFARVQSHYPMLVLVPDSPQSLRTGSEANRQQAIAEIEIVRNQHLRLGNLSELEFGQDGTGSLHQALTAYQDHITATDIEVANPKPHGKTRWHCVARFKLRHADKPLAAITLDRIQEMVDYWRARPNKSGTQKPIAHKSAIHHVGELKRFFKWLHKSDKFPWRKPTDFEDLECKVATTAKDIQARETVDQVQTFNVEQLTTLYKYATPIERLILLLGLNCAFGAAEQGSLLPRQIFFDHKHPKSKRFKLEGPATFVKRIRLKNSVYGEHKLWPTTVAGLQWWLTTRETSGLVFTTTNGKPFWKSLGRSTGNFGKLWRDLIDRVQRDNPKFPRLSFGKLRKTSANLVREISTGEIAKVHLCHGKPVAGDELSEVYANKPFGKVFRALGKVEAQLAPMFAAVAEPFAEHRKSYLGLSKTERILELYDAGTPLAGIVAELGIAASTIYRTLEGAGRQTKRYVKKTRTLRGGNSNRQNSGRSGNSS